MKWFQQVRSSKYAPRPGTYAARYDRSARLVVNWKVRSVDRHLRSALYLCACRRVAQARTKSISSRSLPRVAWRARSLAGLGEEKGAAPVDHRRRARRRWQRRRDQALGRAAEPAWLSCHRARPRELSANAANGIFNATSPIFRRRERSSSSIAAGTIAPGSRRSWAIAPTDEHAASSLRAAPELERMLVRDGIALRKLFFDVGKIGAGAATREAKERSARAVEAQRARFAGAGEVGRLYRRRRGDVHAHRHFRSAVDDHCGR